jgi:hypothetical protein
MHTIRLIAKTVRRSGRAPALPATLLCLLLFCAGARAQSDPLYIDGPYYIGAPYAEWYGDVTLGPNAQVYIQDGTTVLFYGANLIVDPAARIYGADAGWTTFPEGSGTASLVFMQPNPNDNSTVQQTLNGGNGSGVGGLPAWMNIEVNNPAGVALTGSNTRITGALTLTAGTLSLAGQDLKLGPSATVAGYDNTKQVVTDGTGYLVKEGLAAGSSFTFPVGRAAGDYTPVTLTNQSGSANDYYVQVKSYAESGLPISGPATGIDRAWNIYGTTGAAATLSLTHNTATDGAAFSEAAAFLTQQTGPGTWMQGPPYNTSGNPSNGGVTSGASTQNRDFTLASSGTADAGWFSVSSDALNPLPLTLLSFTAQAVNGQGLLQWTTSSEYKTSYFLVQRSGNNISWDKIGQVTAAGQNTGQRQYNYTDAAPGTGSNYYRLEMVDLDGTVTYSPIRQLSFDGQRSIQIIPNPASSLVSVLLPAGLSGPVVLQVFSASGQLMLRQEGDGRSSLGFNVSTWARGTYMVVLSSNGKMLTTRRLIKK